MFRAVLHNNYHIISHTLQISSIFCHYCGLQSKIFLHRGPKKATAELVSSTEAFLSYSDGRRFIEGGSLARAGPTPPLTGCTVNTEVFNSALASTSHIVQELCESRGGRPELSVLTSLLVSVDVKNHHHLHLSVHRLTVV